MREDVAGEPQAGSARAGGCLVEGGARARVAIASKPDPTGEYPLTWAFAKEGKMRVAPGETQAEVSTEDRSIRITTRASETCK